MFNKTSRSVVLLAGIATVLAGGTALGQDESPLAVPLDLSWRDVVVEVRINGQGPYPLILDAPDYVADCWGVPATPSLR